MSEDSTFWWGPWAKSSKTPPHDAAGVSSTEAAERQAELVRKRKRRGLPTTAQAGLLGAGEETPVWSQTLGS